MLSETLRFELAPLNVRVITLVAGNVDSNMSSGRNGPPPAGLPSSSYYKGIEQKISKREKFANMDTAKFADEVVNAVVSGATGKVWKGGNMGVVRWLVPVMPSFIYVSVGQFLSRRRWLMRSLGSNDDIPWARIGQNAGAILMCRYIAGTSSSEFNTLRDNHKLNSRPIEYSKNPIGKHPHQPFSLVHLNCSQDKANRSRWYRYSHFRAVALRFDNPI